MEFDLTHAGSAAFADPTAEIGDRRAVSVRCRCGRVMSLDHEF